MYLHGKYRTISLIYTARRWILCAIVLLSPVLLQPALAVQQKRQDTISSRYAIIVKKDPFDKERGGSESDSGEGLAGNSEGIGKDYELYGIIRTGEIRRAYLKSKKRKPSRSRVYGRKKKKSNRPEFRIVREGDLVDGWKVEEITPTGIIISSHGRTITMNVFSSPKTGRRSTRPVAIQDNNRPSPVKPSSLTQERAKNRRKTGSKVSRTNSKGIRTLPASTIKRLMQENHLRGSNNNATPPILRPESLVVPAHLPARNSH